MMETFFGIILFFTIFCFLTYSCMWFGRTIRRYQEEVDRQRRAQIRSQDCRISVYTLEEGAHRQTVINYNTGRPYKNYELPPAYADAIRMYNSSNSPTEPPTEPPQYSINVASTSQINQHQISIPARRNSATI